MADRRKPGVSVFGNAAPVFGLLRLVFALGAAFCPPPCSLAGQELSPPESGGSFYVEGAGEDARFIQRLVWERAEYAYLYEFALEMESGGEYVEIRREFRAENFIELSLPPGSYRYRIRVYNLLNRPVGLSLWIPFRVLPALQPELYSFSQEFLPADDPPGGVEIRLYGRNIVEGAELYLSPVDADAEPAMPEAVFLSGESARLVFRPPPAPGPYRVYVKNPGGLESSLEIVVAAPPAGDSGSGGSPPAEALPRRRPFDLYAGAAYAPLFPLHGDLFDRLGGSLYPAGASLRIACVFWKPAPGDLGLELAPSWFMLTGGGVTIHMTPVHLNALYQRWLPDQTLSLVFRLGGGISLVWGTNGDGQHSLFTWIPSASAEAALRWYPKAPANARWAGRGVFYVEAGAGYAHIFSVDSPRPGFIRPFLGAGWKI
ncbi:MAG: hypothetical protein LBH35_11055 [Treponema sp.]|jgi:hypothetical protein|nr:hypothetical protein [Treponema sp.]